jgi:hypothetical protein
MKRAEVEKAEEISEGLIGNEKILRGAFCIWLARLERSQGVADLLLVDKAWGSCGDNLQ